MVESAVMVGSIDAELCTWRNLGYREPAIGYTQIYNPAEGSLVAQLVKNPPAMWETWV